MYFEKQYAAYNYDFDKNRTLKPMTVMNFLQDISTEHFETATAHVPKDILNGLWVIVEWHIQFGDLPQLASYINVKTIPTYFRKFIAYRDYIIEDSAGNALATGMSKWAYIDPVSRRQSNLPKLLNEIFSVPEDADKPGKLDFETISTDIANLPDYEVVSVYSDLDVNCHVNNVTYIRWAIDALGSGFMDQAKLTELKVNFKREVFEGEKVIVETYKKEIAPEGDKPTKAITIHEIKSSTGETCVKLQLNWTLIDTQY